MVIAVLENITNTFIQIMLKLYTHVTIRSDLTDPNISIDYIITHPIKMVPWHTAQYASYSLLH